MKFSIPLLLTTLFSLTSTHPTRYSLSTPRANQQRSHDHCNCTGASATDTTGTYICSDPRLGPATLPTSLPLSGYLTSYDRFGGLEAGAFLAKWTVNGSYIYPPQNGFSLDLKGNAINGSMVLLPGTLVDRFGSEYGLYFLLPLCCLR